VFLGDHSHGLDVSPVLGLAQVLGNWGRCGAALHASIGCRNFLQRMSEHEVADLQTIEYVNACVLGVNIAFHAVCIKTHIPGAMGKQGRKNEKISFERRDAVGFGCVGCGECGADAWGRLRER
jgi:hypothetical protein